MIFNCLFFFFNATQGPNPGGAPKGGGPKGGGPNPEKVGPRNVGPRRVGPRRMGARRLGARRVGAQTQKKWGPRRVGTPKGGGPKVGAPKGGGPEGGGPKISRFFFPSPAAKFVLSSLSGCLLVEFWWCLKRRDAQMCAFGVLGQSSPGGPVWWGRRGFTRQPESPNVHI